jgi:hypothetical protein
MLLVLLFATAAVVVEASAERGITPASDRMDIFTPSPRFPCFRQPGKQAQHVAPTAAALVAA